MPNQYSIPKIGMRHKQQGTALFTALIILVAVTIVSLASLGTSMLELKMSGNEESSTYAFEAAQAAIDEMVRDHQNNFPVVGAVGYKRCTTNAGISCDTFDIVLPDKKPFSAKENNTKIVIERVTEDRCPPRSRRIATSCKAMNAATFQVDATWDRSWRGDGRSDLSQGFIVLVPKTQAGSTGAVQADHN